MRKNIYWFFVMAAALLLGAVLSSAIQGAAGLSWLTQSIGFDIPANTYINLSVLTLTVGFSFRISVIQIITVIIGLIIYYNTVKKVTEGK